MSHKLRTIIFSLSALLMMTNIAACGSNEEEMENELSGSELISDESSQNSDSLWSYTIVDTGQSRFFNADGAEIVQPNESEAFYGQDAQFNSTAMSFTDNGDGTITDNITNLIWQQSPPEVGTNWFEANDYCNNLSLAGVEDWRTPTLKELFGLNDFSEGWPYINTDYFHLVESANQAKDQQFWAQDYLVDNEDAAQNKSFGVNHMTGHIKAYADGSSGEEMPRYVRCVSGVEYGINDFIDNGDSTVTDRATGLMWAQNDSGFGLDWQSALEMATQANGNNYLGYSDWRLPNVKELQSIVDYSGVYPAINEELFFVSDEHAYFWTSTSAYFSRQNPTHYYAWYVAFGYAVGPDGFDDHGAGAVRFDTKSENGPDAEEPPRIYNYARLVRDAD